MLISIPHLFTIIWGYRLTFTHRFLPSAVSLDGQLMCLNSYQITEFTDQGLNISARWIKFMFRLISVKKKGADLNRPFFILSLKSLPNAFVLSHKGREKKLRDFI
jgi:hypothetical protein